MKVRMMIALALLGTSAGLASAQTTTAPTAPAKPAAGATAANKPALKGKHAAIEAAKIPILDALAIAEKIGGPGTAIEFEFERGDHNGPSFYEIQVLYPDGKLVEQVIDANTGELLMSETQSYQGEFAGIDPKILQSAKTALRDAITKAEKEIGGSARAVEAELDKVGSDLVYKIDLATPTGKQKVTVDKSGTVQKR